MKIQHLFLSINDVTTSHTEVKMYLYSCTGMHYHHSKCFTYLLEYGSMTSYQMCSDNVDTKPVLFENPVIIR